MSFPFVHKFTYKLPATLTIAEQDRALVYFKEFLATKTAEGMRIEGNELTFKVPFFRVRKRSNPIGAIEGGRISFLNTNEGFLLRYEFYLVRFFILIAASSVLFTLVTKHLVIGALYFILMGGINWWLIIAKQQKMLASIAKEMDIILSKNSAPGM